MLMLLHPIGHMLIVAKIDWYWLQSVEWIVIGSIISP